MQVSILSNLKNCESRITNSFKKLQMNRYIKEGITENLQASREEFQTYMIYLYFPYSSICAIRKCLLNEMSFLKNYLYHVG